MIYYDKMEDLIGETPIRIRGMYEGSQEITIEFASGKTAEFYHSQDCCEHVSICDVDGDDFDLLNHPLTTAESATEDNPAGGDECSMWTFYRFGTANGFVVVRWLGESNGYYGVGVSYRVSNEQGVFDKYSRW